MSSLKVFIKSYGCQMNVYDATRMADALHAEGYAETTDQNAADLVVLNTCHIRERASEKVYSELGRVNELKLARAANGKATLIAVAGCVAQADGAEIIRRQPSVDIVIGTQSYHRFPEALKRVQEKSDERYDAKSGVVITDFGDEDKFVRLIPPTLEKTQSRGVTAFVTVQEGCDKFCTFCVVPYTRGIETSRPLMQIVQEIERLAEAGVREVTLLGQNVNAYHGSNQKRLETSLARLIEAIAAIPGIIRIRYMTSHPLDMGQDLIDAHRDVPALMPFVHLPVQSGSDRVLKAMNRKHNARDYLNVIERLRLARPDVAISSDFIVGFPGETQAEFEETLALIRNVEFSSAYSFKYSSRPGTSAAALVEQVEEAVKSERLLQLQELLEAQRRKINRATVGKTVDVLFEKSGRYEHQIIGKTPHMQAIYAEGSAGLIGSVQSVEVLEMGPNSFRGHIVGGAVS